MTIILLILLVLVLILLTVAYSLFMFAAVRLPTRSKPKMPKWILPYWPEIQSGGDWFEAQQKERIELPSRDGLKLVGWFLPAEHARGTLLLVHGFRSNHRNDFGLFYPYYHSLGFNILAVDQRTHGESEGKYITFGVKERFDMLDWTRYLYDRFGAEHRVILDGVSMGATTVLMALGTGLPANVRGVIADSGFTSPYDQFVHMCKDRFHLPLHPLMEISGLFLKYLAGFDAREYSTVTALQQSTLPVLFFHGGHDNFVLLRCTETNYAVCRGEKQLITVPEAGHCGSYMLDRPRCQAALEEFLNKVAP